MQSDKFYRKITVHVTAASGTGHNIGTATYLQRGQVGSSDLATLEGSSCTDIMTYTEGCGYSF